jgi:hypothetical protein
MTYCLPEREENDEFNAEQFEEWFMRRKRRAQSYVKGNQTIHSNCDSGRVDSRNPDMGILRTQ